MCVNQTEKLQPRGTFFVIIIAKSVYDNKIKTIFFFFLNAETKVTNTRNCLNNCDHNNLEKSNKCDLKETFTQIKRYILTNNVHVPYRPK